MTKKQPICDLGTIGGVTTLGERGQIVIPKEMRNRLKLRKGDSFLVIEHFGKIIFVPQKQAEKFIGHIMKEWGKINNKKNNI
jgi:AbrB family looped-hinge helix DNA binding protein